MGMSMNAGYAITLLGMAIVFCFIALLALAIHFLSRFKGELEAPVEVAAPAVDRSGELVAVISAALHAHGSFARRRERRA
jgi:sodium pump decarboxylase gamma subunit